MGKGWSRGLSATTDARVARRAAAHRGLRYQRNASAPAPTREWTDELAYAVGLIATDGCLVGTGRHIAFTTVDQQLAETLLRCLGRPLRYGTGRTPTGRIAYRVQIGDVRLYRWLESIGLTPRKSLTLGPIAVPNERFLPFTRGLLDGDGSIINKSFRADTRGRSDYFWECLQVKFISASSRHVAWLGDKLHEVAGVQGYLRTHAADRGRHPMTELRFGKRASLVLLPLLYRDRRDPCLERKRAIWDDYLLRHRSSATIIDLRHT